MIYLSNFLPSWFFSKNVSEITNEFHEESDEILGLSSMIEIHKRLEKIEKLKFGEFEELDKRLDLIEVKLEIPANPKVTEIDNQIKRYE